jgi:uncharacterized membrane protein
VQLPVRRAGHRVERLRNVMGSWGFVFGALMFLTGWTIGNRNAGFAPYPFILLNLVLSCLAAMQGAILLIAAKRADQISSELALAAGDRARRSEEPERRGHAARSLFTGRRLRVMPRACSSSDRVHV